MVRQVYEQYLARLNQEEHKKVQEAAEWLFQNGYIKSKSKLAITRYALFTLVNIVNKKRAEQQAKTSVPQTSPTTVTTTTNPTAPPTASTVANITSLPSTNQ